MPPFLLGLVLIGLLAVGAYERGSPDAPRRRAHRIAELRARQVVVLRGIQEQKAS